MATMILKDTNSSSMKHKLADILALVSWGIVAKDYFSRSASWFYQKMNGIDGNLKSTDFSKEEKSQLKSALYDIAERIKRAADLIEAEDI